MLKSILIVPDAHRPYHDQRAWNLMLKVARDLRPKILVIMGDLGDCWAVSSHSKDPARASKISMADEVADVNHGLDELDRLGAEEKHYILGNHEDRLQRYIQEKAPELRELVSIPKSYRLKDRGYKVTPYKEDCRVGKCYFTHDVGVAGRYAAYTALDTYQHSVVTAHTHRVGYVVEGNAVGEYKLSAQFGWLGDRTKIDYMHRAKVNKNWALGFGVGYLDTDTGINYLTPIPIVNYTAVFNGKLYKG